jgi:hypothetical protein
VLKYPLPDNIHKGIPEFFADGDLATADKDMVVPDGIDPETKVSINKAPGLPPGGFVCDKT